MIRFVNIRFRALLKKLHIGEHYDFFQNGIITGLSPLISSLPMLNIIFNALQTVFQREDDFYKQSMASTLTAEITFLHEKRIALFNYIWYCVGMTKYYNNTAMKEAADKLKLLRNNYRHLSSASYQDASGIMTNFLEDCMKPEWKPSLEAINMMDTVNMAVSTNNTFKSLYRERSIDKETVVEMGKLHEIRTDVDSAFDALIETVNVAWRENEMGAKNASVRANLTEVRRIIDASIHQAELTLARRGHHKTKDEDKTDEGTQTPDASNPQPPGTTDPNQPNETPNIINPQPPGVTPEPPTDGPHVLDPNEHPPAGE
ncbi:MAG: DUF6261 family protein [Tannerellaceae bacterium]|jgi:hypothetical protein|nr:DUF6261 family protein [Tannerellaceae bacterium]